MRSFLADNLTETLHEAYCVLKKGGKLVVSDFYIKDGEKVNTENQGGSKNCLDGAFVPEELKTALTEMGFKILFWEDKNKELKDFTAALICIMDLWMPFLNLFYRKVKTSPFLPVLKTIKN
jgi:ubiquinone/menaquinone biosynthesis C-methylase UbiE